MVVLQTDNMSSLEVPADASFRMQTKKKKKILPKHLIIFVEGLWSVETRFRGYYVAPIIGPEVKRGHVTLFYYFCVRGSVCS